MLSMQAFAYDLYIDGIYYNANATKNTLVVTHGENEYTGTINIPSTIEYKGRTLTVIGIGKEAFKNSAIREVKLSNTIESIESHAFENCENLQGIEFNDNLTTIGDSTFFGCKGIKRIKLGNTTSIGEYSFYDCTNLEDVQLGNIRSIGCSAFRRCSKLKELVIPITTKTIENFAFAYSGLERLVILGEEKSNNLTFDNSKYDLFQESCDINTFLATHLQYIYLGRNLKIGDAREMSLFRELPIKKIEISDNVTNLPSNFFGGIDSLDTITIPSSVKSLFQSDFQLRYSYSPTQYPKKINNLIFKDSMNNPLYVTDEFGFSLYGDFYLGRDLDCYKRHWFYANDVYIGKYVTTLKNISLYANDRIITYATVPPTNASFSNSTYLNTQLYVPKGCLEVYKNADGWKNFWNIEEFDTSSTDEIEANSAHATIDANAITISGLKDGEVAYAYSLTGRLLGTAKSQQGKAIINHNTSKNEVVLVKTINHCWKIMAN